MKWDSFGNGSIGELKNSLLITEEFFDARKLRTLQRRKSKLLPRFSSGSSNSDLLENECVVLVFWLKFQKFFANYFFNLVILWNRINVGV